jgi:hypothetical protein
MLLPDELRSVDVRSDGRGTVGPTVVIQAVRQAERRAVSMPGEGELENAEVPAT